MGDTKAAAAAKWNVRSSLPPKTQAVIWLKAIKEDYIRQQNFTLAAAARDLQQNFERQLRVSQEAACH
jgi:hypothetical protein